MLDENLPTFFLKPFVNNGQDSVVYLSQHGSEREPAYTFRRPDPTLATSKNCYSIALFDPYNPDVLFAEVLVKPEWTQPTLSAEEIRKNGGVPPPPQPIIPNEFVIQLYSPDQQVHVRQKQSSWGGSAFWEFELPQRSFREPSSSSLDRSQRDPAAAATTPRLYFRWKKDGKLSKDLICSHSGKTSNSDGGKKKSSSKEPDITVSLFKYLREVTVYEPNLYRVDLEDWKGLEVVLLLSATVIRDMFLGNIRETFNLAPPQRQGSGELSQRTAAPVASGALANPPPAVNGHSNLRPGQPPQAPLRNHQDPPRQGQVPPPPPRLNTGQPPPASPRPQWEVDAETSRAQKQAEFERRSRERADEAESKRIRKMVEAEQKAERRRQAEVDRETERLRKVFAAEQMEAQRRGRAPQPPPRHAGPQSFSAPLGQNPFPRPQSVPQHHHGHRPQQHPRPMHAPHQGSYPQHARPVQAPPHGPYLQPPTHAGHASSSGFFSSHGQSSRPDQAGRLGTPKRSLFRLRAHSDSGGAKLNTKKSSLF
ncbi:MAG: hypothetical protein M1837_005747 [Sclerophora amabilis]|nr:MAG: hypothetical protein M1837_005747 [Sclerophora amabilis]